MQLLGIIILLSLLILLFLAAIYFARGQTSHKTPYDSWSSILGPRNGAGRVMDTTERVLNEIGSSQGQKRRRKRSH